MPLNIIIVKTVILSFAATDIQWKENVNYVLRKNGPDGAVASASITDVWTTQALGSGAWTYGSSRNDRSLIGSAENTYQLTFLLKGR